MSYGILFLIIACGLVGPLLAGVRRLTIPMILGEILAGVVIGRTGFNLLPLDDATLAFLSMIGLALLELLVGMRLPIRNPELKKDFSLGVKATVCAFLLAAPFAYAIARFSGIGHFSMFLVLLSASSAAIVMPIVFERQLGGPTVTRTVTWIAIADTVTVFALSLVMTSGDIVRVLIGSVLVILAAGAGGVFLKWFQKHPVGDYYRQESKTRHWALDLRLSLLLLVGLCWLATSFGASILIAGFAAGAVIAGLDMPPRLTKQLTGLAEGFLVPMFFVVLGARLDFRALIHTPSVIALAAAIWFAALCVHLVVSKIVKLPLGSGLMATATSGISAAVVSLGITDKILTPAEGAAVITAMMMALITCSVGTSLLQKVTAHEKKDPPKA